MTRTPKLRGRAARLARLIPVARGGGAARTPFVLLVVLLLGGGLIGLLMLNSALSEGAFKIGDLQRGTKSLTDEEQALQRDVDAYSAPDALQRRAHELGMVPGGDPAFLDPDGSVKGVPSAAAEPVSDSTAADPSAAGPASLRPPEVPSPSPTAPTAPAAPSPAGGAGPTAGSPVPPSATHSPAAAAAPTVTPSPAAPATPKTTASTPPVHPSTTPGR
ncbi:septum formation initiator family protein [Streptomyces nodosus]|uniref:septum formation initiator family protein n=1 Tax=Streptomyces nodosus TaxID=40318 RepID=UPI00345531F8